MSGHAFPSLRFMAFPVLAGLAGLAWAALPSAPVSNATPVDTVPISLIEADSSLDSTAADSLIASGARGIPFALRAPSPKELANFQLDWKEAMFDEQAGRFNKAMTRLRRLQPTEKLAQIYRTLFFAEVALAANAKPEADSALEATLHWARGAAWQRQLYTQRLATFDFKSATRAARKEFCALALRARLDPWAKAALYYQLLTLEPPYLTRTERMDVLRKLVRVAVPNPRLDSLYKNLAVEWSGVKVWEEQKLLLDFEQKLGYTQKAFDRVQTMMALAPDKQLLQALQLNSADLQFRKGSYLEAAQAYRKYEESYGPQPELFLQQARAQRRLFDEPQAQKTYSRLLEAFPKSPKSMDVYWMRAFEAESAGRTAEAVELYSRLKSTFPDAQQADRAAFRVGLTYFKARDFTSALTAFQAFRRPNAGASRSTHAALYWEGKTFLAQGDTASALRVWLELSRRFPFTYYGHYARLNLMARHVWPDSLEWRQRFPLSGMPGAKAWLASLGSTFRDSEDVAWQSAYLPVPLLLEWKESNLALLTLRSQPLTFFSNPQSLYVAASQLQDAGLWTEAYRFGTMLANLIPLEDWSRAPRAVLRLFYPPAYDSPVRKWAAQTGVPAGFVFALMKQESGFDSQAVSRVGARGLMQLMPATGTAQAKREGVSGFTPDDLFLPDINIRLGSAYLRDLQNRYPGNLYFTLAHYNAGPDALNAWMPQLANRPMDEMVEDIGFSETREYVKRVLSNYWTYQALYE